MDYIVNTGSWGSLFAVPDCVVDEYIKLASGQAVKVLLYVLRNGNRKIDKNEIAAALNINDETIDDAFNFWESVGVLSSGNGAVSQPPAAENRPNPPAVETSSQHFNLRPTEIAERVRSSEQIRYLFTTAEATFGRMLNNTDQRSLIWIHEYLGLSVDVILMLIQYCVSLGKNNVLYIERVAFEWQEKNICTLDDAQNEIQRHQLFDAYEKKILFSLGINSKPSVNQSEIIKNWYDKNISSELVECAYNRTMDSIGRFSMPYMNSIIMSWNEKGISSCNDITEFEKNNPPPKRTYNRNNSRNTPKKRKKQSYDIDEFEKFAINYEELKKAGE